MASKKDWRRARNVTLVVEKSCGHHRKEDWIFCAATQQDNTDQCKGFQLNTVTEELRTVVQDLSNTSG